MPSHDEILARLRPSLATLEAERRSLLIKRNTGKIWITGFLLGGLLLTFLLSKNGAFAGLITLVIAAIGALICHSIFFNATNARYQQGFKHKVVSKVVKTLAPQINFHPSQFISKDWFIRSQLFARPDRYRGEDYYIGKIGKTELFFSEVHAEQKHTSTDSKGHTKTHYTTLFKGIFLIADFHKEFRSKVTVTPDKLEGFGFLGKKLQQLGGRVERMENVEFERLFVVRASDPVEARYILTPTMQERFIELTRKWTPEIRASFQDSLVYLALPTKSDWFEGDIKTSVADPHQFRNLVAQLSACLSTVEDLDLNTRIWTKE